MTDDTTSLIEQGPFDAACAKGYEGLFTQGSGYLHIRGSFEEGLAAAPQNVTYLRRPANVTAEKFPEMKVKWGTYPTNKGHLTSAGCFRCHDESHTAKDQTTISGDCGLCHTQLESPF